MNAYSFSWAILCKRENREDLASVYSVSGRKSFCLFRVHFHTSYGLPGVFSSCRVAKNGVFREDDIQMQVE